MKKKSTESETFSSADSINTHPQWKWNGNKALKPASRDMSGQWDLESPNTAQHSTMALGTQSQQSAPMEEAQRDHVEPILCVRSSSTMVLITWLRGREVSSNNS